MLAGAIQVGHENIHNRMKPPYYVAFGNRAFVTGQHQLFSVDPSDIFFVSPAVFLWIDTGIQELKSMTTNPNHVKLIDTLICQTPVMDFKDITEKYSHLLMVTNLNYNVNFKSKRQVEDELKDLNLYITKAKELFTGNII